MDWSHLYYLYRYQYHSQTLIRCRPFSTTGVQLFISLMPGWKGENNRTSSWGCLDMCTITNPATCIFPCQFLSWKWWFLDTGMSGTLWCWIILLPCLVRGLWSPLGTHKLAPSNGNCTTPNHGTQESRHGTAGMAIYSLKGISQHPPKTLTAGGYTPKWWKPWERDPSRMVSFLVPSWSLTVRPWKVTETQ